MTRTDQQLYDAVEHGDTSAVRRLVEQIDQVPGYVLFTAVRHKRVEQIILLAPKCDYSTICQAFFNATFHKPLDMLHALLPYTDENLHNRAMVNACALQNTNAVELLYPLCDINTVLSLMEHHTSWFMDVWRATFRERLNSNMDSTVAPPIQEGRAQSEDPDIHFITPQIMDDVRSGNIEGVQRFLNSNPLQSDMQKMIEVAAVNDRLQCLRMILSCSEMTHDRALVLAAGQGHAQCVELLIPVSNPCARNSGALSSAVVSGNQRCVDLLLPVSDPHAALDTIKHTYRNPQLYEFLERAIAQHQKQLLEETLGDASNSHGVRKM